MWCQMLYDHCSGGLEGVKTRCQNMVSKRDMTTMTTVQLGIIAIFISSLIIFIFHISNKKIFKRDIAGGKSLFVCTVYCKNELEHYLAHVSCLPNQKAKDQYEGTTLKGFPCY